MNICPKPLAEGHLRGLNDFREADDLRGGMNIVDPQIENRATEVSKEQLRDYYLHFAMM